MYNRLQNSIKYQIKNQRKLNYRIHSLEESLAFHLENYKEKGSRELEVWKI